MDALNSISNKKNQIPLKCEICDTEFKNNNGLRRHFNIVHKLLKEHQCNICQNAFKLQCQLGRFFRRLLSQPVTVW